MTDGERPVRARTDTSDPWFRRAPAHQPHVRLVCFPHAGGTATLYATWANRLPAGVELLAVQYPGRQNRLSEPCATTMAELVEPLTGALGRYLDAPVALFGHSMGSAVAYEVALRLRAITGTRLTHLLVSGRAAPDAAPPSTAEGLDDDSLLDSIRRLDGPDVPAYGVPELRDLLLPSLRGDYRLMHDYRATEPDEPLDVPITAYGGDRDPACPVDALGSWAALTTGAFDSVVFPGGHFYLREHEAALLADVTGWLAARSMD